jgi:hypothetical protein
MSAVLGVGAQTLSVQLRPVADTTLIETEPGNNLGGASFVNAGTTGISTLNHGLVQFDFTSAIPRDAVILAASLQLEVVFAPSRDIEFDLFGLHRVLTPWGEGDKVADNPNSPGLGAPASLNEATWSHRFAGTADTWAAPGGLAGVDYVPAASSVEFIEGEGNYLFDTSFRMTGDVQSWIDDPASNNGWMLIGFTGDLRYTARRFGAREDSEFAPLLTVTFQVIPEPSPLLIGTLGLAAMCLWRLPGRRRGVPEVPSAIGARN